MDVTPRSESQLNPSSHGKCIIGLFPTHLSRLDRVHREIPCRNRVPRRLVSILAPLGLVSAPSNRNIQANNLWVFLSRTR